VLFDELSSLLLTVYRVSAFPGLDNVLFEP
jgi:hypothetical protein